MTSIHDTIHIDSYIGHSAIQIHSSFVPLPILLVYAVPMPVPWVFLCSWAPMFRPELHVVFLGSHSVHQNFPCFQGPHNVPMGVALFLRLPWYLLGIGNCISLLWFLNSSSSQIPRSSAHLAIHGSSCGFYNKHILGMLV